MLWHPHIQNFHCDSYGLAEFVPLSQTHMHHSWYKTMTMSTFYASISSLPRGCTHIGEYKHIKPKGKVPPETAVTNNRRSLIFLMEPGKDRL